ncbi:MAG: RluA family pseudouridine synthase [bacterium]|nr:RluA family pseudouridine synthase [bacterium]
MKTAQIVVQPGFADQRLDQFLAAATTLSRRRARLLIGEGKVQLNRRLTKVASRMVEAGDVVLVADDGVVSAADHEGTIQQTALIFEDRWLVAANKPAGTLSQSSEHSRPGELALNERLLIERAKLAGKRPFLRLVHRLDRIASGVLLFACHPNALKGLARAWQEGSVTRDYLALVSGESSIDTSVIDAPIARDRDHYWRFRTAPHGKLARTRVCKLHSYENGFSLVACRLLTGRTHQVRVHLSAIGHPLVGDGLYGGESHSDFRRPLLHAWSLELKHPVERGRVRITAPLPERLIDGLPEQVRERLSPERLSEMMKSDQAEGAG